MRAPRARAEGRLSRRSAPAPEDGTKPAAEALIGREAFSGASLNPRQVTRIASKAAQEYLECPSDPPAIIRLARPSRIRKKASTTASVPVLHALELVETRLPRPSSPPIRALLPLHIDCSATVLPMRATLRASVRGTSLSATVSMPP